MIPTKGRNTAEAFFQAGEVRTLRPKIPPPLLFAARSSSACSLRCASWTRCYLVGARRGRSRGGGGGSRAPSGATCGSTSPLWAQLPCFPEGLNHPSPRSIYGYYCKYAFLFFLHKDGAWSSHTRLVRRPPGCASALPQSLGAQRGARLGGFGLRHTVSLCGSRSGGGGGVGGGGRARSTLLPGSRRGLLRGALSHHRKP